MAEENKPQAEIEAGELADSALDEVAGGGKNPLVSMDTLQLRQVMEKKASLRR